MKFILTPLKHLRLTKEKSTLPPLQVLFTAGADSFIKSWLVSTGQMLRTIDGHDGAVLCMTVFNRLMYTGGADMLAKCWTKDYGDCTKVYRGHKHSVICLSLSMGNRELDVENSNSVLALNYCGGTFSYLFGGKS